MDNTETTEESQSHAWTMDTLHPDVNDNSWPEEDEKGELYEFCECGAEGEEGTYGLLLWCSEAGRAGVVLNGNPTWTDADSPEDALSRHLAGTMTDA